MCILYSVDIKLNLTSLWCRLWWKFYIWAWLLYIPGISQLLPCEYRVCMDFYCVPWQQIEYVIQVINKHRYHCFLRNLTEIELVHVQWNLIICTSLIRTPYWEPIPMPQQKVTHLPGNSVIRTVSLGTEASG